MRHLLTILLFACTATTYAQCIGAPVSLPYKPAIITVPSYLSGISNPTDGITDIYPVLYHYITGFGHTQAVCYVIDGVPVNPEYQGHPLGCPANECPPVTSPMNAFFDAHDLESLPFRTTNEIIATKLPMYRQAGGKLPEFCNAGPHGTQYIVDGMMLNY